jgi:hypothetical protein
VTILSTSQFRIADWTRFSHPIRPQAHQCTDAIRRQDVAGHSLLAALVLYALCWTDANLNPIEGIPR